MAKMSRTKLLRDYPFAVLNTDKGFEIHHMFAAEKNSVMLSHLKHDTSRQDPTLVLDVLRETYDPETVRKQFYFQYRAFFPTLDAAIKAVEDHEKRFGWERQHIEDCRKALELAKRNYRAAEQSQKHTVWAKFEGYPAASPHDVSDA